MIAFPAWYEDAVCASVGGDFWFPEKGGDSGKEAKKVCASCPVASQCLEWALDNGERHGVWGGKSDRERRKLGARRRCRNCTPGRAGHDPDPDEGCSMRPPWMDPDEPGPTALCVTDPSAREAHQWASDVPGGPQSAAVRRAHSEARFWCNRCDVRDACLSFALAAEGKDDDRARDGVYGGVDPIGRATLAGRSPKVFPPIACGVCNTKFAPGSSSARYCSDKCSLTAVRRRQSKRVKAKRDLARQGQAA